MARAIRQISISFFCSIYLAVSLAGLVGTMRLPAISSGPHAVASATAIPKEKPKVFWAQRRHTPAVKQFSFSAAAWIKEQYPTKKDCGTFLPLLNRTPPYPLFHSERRSTRAPPLA